MRVVPGLGIGAAWGAASARGPRDRAPIVAYDNAWRAGPVLLRELRRRCRRRRPGAVILAYHRIAAVPDERWALAVTPTHFSEQLEVLRRHRTVVSLATLLQRRAGGRPLAGLAAVTFDDGYVDGLENAKPRLERHDVPATVFVASGWIGSSEAFWWDQVGQIVQHAGSLPAALELTVAGRHRRWRRAGERRATPRSAAAEALRAWLARRFGPVALRKALIDTIRRLPASDRQQVLVELQAALGNPSTRPATGRPMTAEDMRALVADGLIAIGAHTVTHPSLPRLSPARQWQEIIDSRRACEAILERPVVHFAYPFGEVDAVTRRLVRDSAMDAACTVEPGTVGLRSDPFLLPRINVQDWPGEEFERRLVLAGR